MKNICLLQVLHCCLIVKISRDCWLFSASKQRTASLLELNYTQCHTKVENKIMKENKLNTHKI